jgi:hypothetical protein
MRSCRYPAIWIVTVLRPWRACRLPRGREVIQLVNLPAAERHRRGQRNEWLSDLSQSERRHEANQLFWSKIRLPRRPAAR